MEPIKAATRSLCNICLREIPASVFIEDAGVVMKKNCPAHGEFRSLVEKDPSCYKSLAHIKSRKTEYFHILIIPVTYKCNLDCEFCYLADREKKDLGVESIKKIIKNFKGDAIGLSGGEPTLRKELPEVIRFINKAQKLSVLLTNGLALEDINYVRMIKEAGLDRVVFSFDGFDAKVYKLIKNSDNNMVERKLKALANLKKEKIPTMLSMTIYKGINESELKKVFEFAVKNNSFIYQIRIRSCTKVGRFKKNIEGYFMSEFLKMFEEIVNIKRYTLLHRHLFRYTYYTPHSVDLLIYFCRIRDKIIIVPFLAKLINAIILYTFRLFAYLGLEKAFKRRAYRLVGEKPFIKQLIVHFAMLPSIENIDLGELESGVAHLYDGKILNFCHALVLNEKL